MNWKDILGLVQNILGIVPTFYYGFRHYVLKKDDYEWEQREDADKVIFYMLTLPIWLLVGIFELFGWIVDKLSPSDSSSNTLAEKNITEGLTPDPSNNSFLLIIHDVFEIQGRGPAVSGIIKRGRISTGDSLRITGIGMVKKATCMGIEHNRQLVKSAGEGERVGLLLKGVNFHDIHIGQSVTK